MSAQHHIVVYALRRLVSRLYRIALARPRSSLLRSGAAVHTAVWDAGYQGRSQALLVVYHPGGYRVQRDARLMQLVFFRMETAASRGYQGRFQAENI